MSYDDVSLLGNISQEVRSRPGKLRPLHSICDSAQKPEHGKTGVTTTLSCKSVDSLHAGRCEAQISCYKKYKVSLLSMGYENQVNNKLTGWAFAHLVN